MFLLLSRLYLGTFICTTLAACRGTSTFYVSTILAALSRYLFFYHTRGLSRYLFDVSTILPSCLGTSFFLPLFVVPP